MKPKYIIIKILIKAPWTASLLRREKMSVFHPTAAAENKRLLREKKETLISIPADGDHNNKK